MWKIIRKSKFLILSGFMLLLTACIGGGPTHYHGQHPELFTVAVNSILGARGQAVDGPRQIAWIVILAEDDFGRILFRYSEDNFGVSEANRVIVQRIRNDYVYFYPHYNFISSSRDYNWDFSNEDINDLKEVNNWNNPLSDDSEFVRVRVSREFPVGPISDQQLVQVYHEIFPGVPLNRHQNEILRMVYFRTDDYGRSIYLGIGMGENWHGVHKAILFQPDHSFNSETGVLLIEDVNNYQTELRLFMETNGWNTPFISE